MYIEEGLKMMIFSPPGHGKTCLLGSIADDERLSPAILLDFESGMMSIKSKVRRIVSPKNDNPNGLPVLGKCKPEKGKIDVITIKSVKDFNYVYEYLSDTKDHPYKTVALDSLTEINYLIMNETIAEASKTDLKHDKDIAEQRDYLRVYNIMRKLIRSFRDLEMNVVLSCLSQHLDDPKTKLKMIAPQLTGKLALEMPGLIDILGYLAIVDEKDSSYRYLVTQPSEKIMAKDRTEGGKLGQGIRNPTMQVLMNLIEGKVNK